MTEKSEDKIDYSLCHEIHTSARRSFKSCRLRYKWHFIDWWTPQGIVPPLEFGIAFHKGMEKLYDPETWGWNPYVLEGLAVKAFVDSCNEQLQVHLRDSGNVSLEPAIEAEFAARVELGKGMLRHYVHKQLPKYPDNFRVIKVEQAFKVPLRHPETGDLLYCRCDECTHRYGKATSQTPPINWKGLPVVYAGRIDAIGEDGNGDYWIIDWKTAAQISADDEFLELDDQITSYVWALRKVLGLPVRGFIYHEQRKGYPKPPERNKVVRLGCSFSVSKSQTTDLETFVATVKDEDTEAYEAGRYDTFIQYLKDEGIIYHKRWELIKTDEELKTVEYDIGNEVLDMLDTNLRTYPSPGKFGCKYCGFRQPCLGRRKGEDVAYMLETLYKNEEPYYYRQERGASTESKGGE